MTDSALPLGKLPAKLLDRLLARAPVDDPRVLLGPGVGLDCAVIEAGEELLVLKSDPITFVTREFGRYLVLINGNDVATTGARARWLLLTLLLPEKRTTPAMAEDLMEDVFAACRAEEVSLVGGHTEITHGLDRPIAVGTLIGTVGRESLITPRGARPGDQVLLTKSVPIEGTAILAWEKPATLADRLTSQELERARQFLFDPGISVAPEARLAVAAGQVTAMHDPTEGGLKAALWELAEASGRSLHVDLSRVPVEPVASSICQTLGIDPLETIASGALLITVEAADSEKVRTRLEGAGIACTWIGEVGEGPADVTDGRGGEKRPVAWPERDGVARAFET